METNITGHGGKRQNAGRPKKDTRQRNESNTNKNHYYKVYIISHPLLS